MIGDRDVLVSHCGCGVHHFAQRRLAVGFGGVHVQVAANVAEFESAWGAALRSGVEFAGVLAQLGRNPLKPEPLVDFFLALARDALVRSSVKRPYSLSVRPCFTAASAGRRCAPCCR